MAKSVLFSRGLAQCRAACAVWMLLAPISYHAEAAGLIEEGMDYQSGVGVGTNYGVPSAEACCAACTTYPGCAAWTWGIAAAGDAKPSACYMKSVAPTAAQKHAQAGITSGLPGCGAAPAATVAPVAAVAPPAATAAPVDPSCSVAGDGCLSTQCCQDTKLKCYSKNKDWADCKSTCTAGAADKNSPVGMRSPWSCDVLGDTAAAGPDTYAPPAETLAPTPAATAVPTPAPTPVPCANTTTKTAAINCALAGCCIDADMTCFMKDALWGQCTKKCKQGVHPTDPEKVKPFWSCSPVKMEGGEIRIHAFGMCGGKQGNKAYSGPKTCLDGCTCKKHSEWSSTCMPDNGHGDSCSGGTWRAPKDGEEDEDDDEDGDSSSESLSDEHAFHEEDEEALDVDAMSNKAIIDGSTLRTSATAKTVMDSVKWFTLGAASLVVLTSVALAIKRRRQTEITQYQEIADKVSVDHPQVGDLDA